MSQNIKSRRSPQPMPPRPTPTKAVASPRAKRSRSRLSSAWVIAAIFVIVFAGLAVVMSGIALFFVMTGSTALSGVNIAGIPVGGLSAGEIESEISAVWDGYSIGLNDADRQFTIAASNLGISIDAAATAQRAVDYGRREGSLAGVLSALFSEVNISPVWHVDETAFATALETLRDQIDIAPINAGVRVSAGEVVPRPAVDGRQMDVNGTLQILIADPDALSDGRLDLVMHTISPAITHADGLVEAARSLLTLLLVIDGYDPILDETVVWAVPPEQWSEWLTVSEFAENASGIQFTADASALQTYLQNHVGDLGATRYLDIEASVSAVQAALNRGETHTTVRVYHHDTQYVVQDGDTFITIAYDYGIPYPYLQNANAGVNTLSVGQTITLPSRDVMLPETVIFNKRIEVSISEQRVRVYENGNLIWDWVASTGINSSPTWPGVYQILSHEPNAYAANWDLWMPNFMGVYRPIPGSDFTNGFHGFPTRGGSQLLWTNNLGTRVTYGCILLGTEEMNLLYNWAEEGVVVEITG